MVSLSRGDGQPVDGRTLRFQHRRSELVDAVMDYVLEHGVANLTFRPLAQAVGVSHVALRNHFGTKEQLVAEVFDHIRARYVPRAVPERDDAEHLVQALWSEWTGERGQRELRLFFEAYGQALMHPDRYRGFLDGVVDDWLGTITATAIAAGCPQDDADRFATVLIAQLRGLILDLLTTGDHTRVQRALDSVLAAARAEADGWGM
jgi:AcrR family transcriptional regulator